MSELSLPYILTLYGSDAPEKIISDSGSTIDSSARSILQNDEILSLFIRLNKLPPESVLEISLCSNSENVRKLYARIIEGIS